ncbi:MAG: ABC transporter ATP-binding protein [Chloroflexi bacterium]|nr:ABC transporter ATP-binding protein [Chloroflexota bacterium]
MSLTSASAPADVHVRVHALSHAFSVRGEDRAALSSVTLDLRRGEFLSLLGPSGCGKSTLLRLAGGLLSPRRGEVSIDGAGPRDAQRAGRIGVVFQDPALLPWRTVEANIRLPLDVRRGTGRPAAIADLISLVGLDGFERYYPHQLSGGMQQRAALARALVTDPPLLLMDEPFGALDDITRTEMRHELLRITARAGKTVLFVTHSITEAVLLSDRVAVMTHRPGHIRAVVDIDLPRPRTTDDETTSAFAGYVRRLRALLQED